MHVIVTPATVNITGNALQVFTEQSWPLDAFCAAVQIMDKFLDICCHILRTQLQVSMVSHINHSVCQLQVRPSLRILLPLKPPPSPALMPS